jgi:serpin B
MKRIARQVAETGLLIAVLLMVLSVTGCELLWPDHPEDGDVAQSNLLRDLDPDVSREDSDELVIGNSTFAFELLQQIAEDDVNLFFSPYSVSSALAMAYAGARGDTETRMSEVLHFSLGQTSLHPSFNWLDLELNDRGEIDPPYEGDGFELNVVNAMWGQHGHPFLDGYLDTLAVSYGAGLRLLDFVREPEGSRVTINDWVSDQTNERIQDLLPPGTISSDTRLVLTNAIYFNAPWLKPFEHERTDIGSFTLLSGASTEVPMMHQEETFAYGEWENGAAVELLYNGGELSMVVLVPNHGMFEAFEQTLDLAKYEEIVASLETRQVNLRLPRFEFTYDVSLVDPLTALGMTDAFDSGAADFSGIDGMRSLFISDVLHKAFVSLDEEGTEAAAATAVVFEFTLYPGPPVTLTIDRPFLFVIRDIPTGTILFVGRVVHP